jgi:hypothetical protein
MGIGGVPVGPRPGFGQAGQLGQDRAAAGADHHRMPSRQYRRPAIGGLHGDPPATGQPPVPADQLGADALQPARLALVVPVGHVPVPAGEHRRGVHRPGDGLARPGDPAGVGNRDDRPEHGLAGDARPVGAFTADQFAFDSRDAEPGGAGPAGDGLPDGPAADDDHVVRALCRSAHVPSIGWS